MHRFGRAGAGACGGAAQRRDLPTWLSRAKRSPRSVSRPSAASSRPRCEKPGTRRAESPARPGRRCRSRSELSPQTIEAAVRVRASSKGRGDGRRGASGHRPMPTAWPSCGWPCRRFCSTRSLEDGAWWWRGGPRRIIATATCTSTPPMGLGAVPLPRSHTVDYLAGAALLHAHPNARQCVTALGIGWSGCRRLEECPEPRRHD